MGNLFQKTPDNEHPLYKRMAVIPGDHAYNIATAALGLVIDWPAQKLLDLRDVGDNCPGKIEVEIQALNDLFVTISREMEVDLLGFVAGSPKHPTKTNKVLSKTEKNVRDIVSHHNDLGSKSGLHVLAEVLKVILDRDEVKRKTLHRLTQEEFEYLYYTIIGPAIDETEEWLLKK